MRVGVAGRLGRSHHPRGRVDVLCHLVHVIDGGDTGPEVEELVDARVREMAYDAA
jgi:hypothetical protein